MHFSVDSQNIVIGSDDTSDGFSEVPDSEFVPIEDNHTENSDDQVNSFIDLAKQLEAERMQNADKADRMAVSNDGERCDGAVNQMIELEDDEWPVARWVRLQEEAEAETNGRLTAPENEIQKRRPRKRPTTNRNDALIDELRAKQIELAEEQIYLQKIQQDTALFARNEAEERLQLIKIQRQIAEIDLNKKQNES